jgi:phage terminase large subunit
MDIAYVEEAQSLSDRSLKLLRPTIRKENSELYFSWNPEKPTDPVDKFFRQNPASNCISVHVNSEQNPFLPDTLKQEREDDRVRMLPEDYDHVWNGAYNTKSDALVFKNKYRVDYFEPNPDWVKLYGLDFGFSQDPTAAVEVFVDSTSNILYIRREAGKVGLEINDTPNFIMSRLPEIEKYKIRADNARPESISYLRNHGLPQIVGEAKLKIEDGITYMRKFNEIILHPECRETIKEFGLYSYKVDKRTGDILPDIVDKYNHYLDAIRYALFPLIKQSTTPSFWFK